jgi:hypothetical protein
LDHRNCGAYNVILGPEHAKDKNIERHTHAEQLNKLKTQIAKKHSNLKIETLLMSLDGKVDTIA